MFAINTIITIGFWHELGEMRKDFRIVSCINESNQLYAIMTEENSLFVGQYTVNEKWKLSEPIRLGSVQLNGCLHKHLGFYAVSYPDVPIESDAYVPVNELYAVV